MKFNKKTALFSLPIVVGLIAGQLVGQKSETKSQNTVPIVEAGSSLQSFKGISDYLITSQTFFSQAIELSATSKNDQSLVDSNNQRVAELINEAINQATEAILHYPTDARGWYQRAKIYQTIEKYNPGSIEAAVADLERTVYLEPENKEYLSALSDLWLQKSDSKKAIFYLSQAVEANPTDAQLCFKLAKLQTTQGLLFEAHANYKKIVPLLVDSEQKELVKKEITAIENLLAQTKGVDFSSLAVPTITATNDLYLPDSPAKLEANNLAQQVIITDPEDQERFISKDSKQYSSNALSGNSTIPAGQTEVEIESNSLTENTQVYVASVGDSHNEVLKVKTKGEDSFVISLSNSIGTDLEFKWWLIQNN